jgi:hypothetical protein
MIELITGEDTSALPDRARRRHATDSLARVELKIRIETRFGISSPTPIFSVHQYELKDCSRVLLRGRRRLGNDTFIR